MAYKFQLGSAIVSGSLTRDSGDLKIRNHANQVKVTLDVTGNATFEGAVSGAAATFDALAGTQLALQGGGITDAGPIAGATTIGASGLASLDGGIDVNGNMTVSAAGAIAGATSIDASGDLTVGSITMAEFAVDSSGNTDVDGTLNVEGVPTFQAGAVFSTGITTANAIAGATTISGSGLAQFGQVRSDGGLTQQGLDILSAARALGNVTTVSGSGKGSFESLALDSVDVTSTAAELNLVDGSSAGSIVNSKAVIYDSNGQINSNGLTGSLRFSLDVAANGGLGMTPFQNNANVNDLKISGSFMQAAAVDVATDEVMMLDADGSVKRESFVDLATAMAGAGITATNGVFSTDAGAAANIADGGTLAEGVNFLTGTDGGSFSLPEGGLGDRVTVKNSSAGSATISGFDGNTIDGATSIILESPFAAVTMVYSTVSASWSII
tara:strand:+ start:646 stop:1965 length:1320 start_codon:yes stop_codon:yes gene_type:complete